MFSKRLKRLSLNLQQEAKVQNKVKATNVSLCGLIQYKSKEVQTKEFTEKKIQAISLCTSPEGAPQTPQLFGLEQKKLFYLPPETLSGQVNRLHYPHVAQTNTISSTLTEATSQSTNTT
jgi:hypothetical protein